MATTAGIREGLCIRFNHDIYKIIEFLHMKPGKGPAFVRTKLKSVTIGKILDNIFSVEHKIEDVHVETRSSQYLYAEGDEFVFMNNDNCNQVHIRKDMFDYPDLLKEGETVMVIFNTKDETPLSAEIPANVILTVTHVEPGVKGNTATNATKPATVETGATVSVPLFINEGNRIKVETEKGTYVERMKD